LVFVCREATNKKFSIADNNRINIPKDYPIVDLCRWTLIHTDLFSAETAEKCPKGTKNRICVNLRVSAVKFLSYFADFPSPFMRE